MKAVSTNKAPAAIGPYSQAQIVGNLVYTSGQIPIIPETGALAEGLEAQARLLRDASEETLDSLEEEQRTYRSRRREIEERGKALLASDEEAKKELASLAGDLEKGSAEADAFRARQSAHEETLREILSRRASLDAEKNTVYIAIEQLEQLRSQLESDSGQRRDAAEAVRRNNEELTARRQTVLERIKVLRGKKEAEQGRIRELTDRRMELEGKRGAADKAAQEKNRELLELEKASARLEQKKIAAEMEEKQLLDKLWDNYELSRSEAEKVRRQTESLSKTARRVAELRRSMNALGTPNLGAIEEYKRVSERYDFLSGQRADVEKARGEILNIISEITSQMEEIFTREIREIDTAFRRIFSELFGGGKAAISLEDENDVLNCGIDIRIQPPGKAVSNISLLSGGEKAFVAIALYFAIMRVRPTPFCVMDEIESALDEENVSRFASYMRLMSDKTQFIAITHRRGTMEEADQLYGVTMQEKGVSTVLEMDMAEALKTIG